MAAAIAPAPASPPAAPLAPPSLAVSAVVLSEKQVVERLRAHVHPYAQQNFRAMYSSILDGIVTDPALMARRVPLA